MHDSISVCDIYHNMYSDMSTSTSIGLCGTNSTSYCTNYFILSNPLIFPTGDVVGYEIVGAASINPLHIVLWGYSGFLRTFVAKILRRWVARSNT